ncbi:3002_t:CDS:2, partial [Scutellospora calospora]
EDRSVEQHRQWIINHVYALLKDYHVKRYEGFLRSILDFLIMYGFFTSKDLNIIKDKMKVDSKTSISSVRMDDDSEKQHVLFESPIPELSEETQNYCRARFFHSLGELCAIRSLDNETSYHRNSTVNDGGTWAYHAVNLMKRFYDDSRIEPLIILSDKAQQIKNDVIILLQEIASKAPIKTSKNDSTRTLQHKGFILLFSFSILALYIEPDEAMNALQDLRVCYVRMFGKIGKSSKKSKKNNETDQDMHNPVDVIVDILLGFLAKPSSFLHNMSEQTFNIFCGDITKSSFDVMIELLNKKNDNEDELVETIDNDNEDDQMMDVDYNDKNSNKELDDSEDDRITDDDYDDKNSDNEDDQIMDDDKS